MVKKRNRSTLEPIIVKHVANGATIFSDSWSAYQNLQHLGFKHYQVNHKEHFIEVHDEIFTKGEFDRHVADEMRRIEEQADDGEDCEDLELGRMVEVHTQRIERAWREVKRGLSGQPLHLLRRNLNVELIRFNSLSQDIPFEQRRDTVLRIVGKHQSKVDQLKVKAFTVYEND